MRTRQLLSTISLIFLLASCNKPISKSTINYSLQNNAEKILRTEAVKSNVDSAIVLIMSVKTGEVKTVVKITKSDSLTYSAKYTEASINTSQEPGSIFIPFSIMAAMEKSNVSLNDTVDTYNGMYNVSGRTFCDQNVNHGGYHKITLHQSILFTSNIGTIVTVGKAFNYSDKFIAQLQKMSIIQSEYNHQVNKKITPDLIASLSIGYDQKMTPLQILTCYNAIANNGRMMKAVFKTDQDSVINPHICSDKTIQAIQQTLCKKADQMLKDNNLANKNQIAGTRGTSQQHLNSGIFDFKYCCSYFPSNNPEYTCLVIFYRERNYEEDQNVRNSILRVINILAGSFKSNLKYYKTQLI
jgi:cell division protein FtsI (penicillin-binding protein 3)